MTAKQRLLKALSILSVLAMISGNLQPVTAAAQSGDGLKRKVNAESGKVSFIGPEGGKPLLASEALGTSLQLQDPALALAEQFAPEFGLQDPAGNLSELAKEQAQNGRLTVKYQQKYQGIPVMGGELIVNTNERGDLYSINGEVSPDLSLQTQPNIDPAQARETALQAVAKWYQGSSDAFTSTEPELWIFDERLLQPSTRPVELVWRLEVTSADNSLPVRELVLVNAKRGGISLHFNQIDTAWTADETTDTTLNPIPQPLEPIETPIHTETIPASFSLLNGLWFVSPSGNDANSCSAPTAPCSTINGAIGKAADGDTIYIETGSYTAQSPSTSYLVYIGKGVSLTGGWNSTFTNIVDYSVIDGRHVQPTMGIDDFDNIFNNKTVTLSNFIVKNSNELGISSRENLIIKNAQVHNNAWGGISATNLSIKDCSVYNNLAGGIYANYVGLTLSVENCDIHHNGGRGISSSTSESTSISLSHVHHNSGGGVDMSGISSQTIDNSAFYFNTASDSGGGVSGGSNSTPLVIKNTTISNNTASRGGGLSSGKAILYNVTVAGNYALEAGGGISASTGTVYLKNSILANNTAQNPDMSHLGNCDIGGVGLDGYTIIYGTQCTLFGPPNAVPLPINADPKLGMLLPSVGYLPLLPGSPAINAGNPATCTANDQRGVTRVGVCDIGAYEYTIPGSPMRLDIVDGNNQRAFPTFNFSTPLSVVALDGQGSPVAGVNVTFTAPQSGASAVFLSTNTRTISALTNPSGIASSSTLKANNLTGAYAVFASATGVGAVNFALANASWYVSPSGRDTNSCSSSVSPCLTIGGGMAKPGFVSGDAILIATGTYQGTGQEVLTLEKSAILLGGWNETFTAQTGMSIIDGQSTRRGVRILSGVVANIDHFMITNGNTYDPIGDGSGVLNYGNLTLSNSSIYRNMAFGSGGGIRNEGSLTLNNTTVSHNVAADDGGGIFNYGTATIYLNNTTISDNAASSYGSPGGGIYNRGVISIKNSILSNNESDSPNTDCAGDGTITSLGNNIIGNVSGCTIATASGDKLNTDPKLGSFLPTRGYYPLEAGSLAINGGNPGTCIANDQRGNSRVGTCDIGAFEYTVPGSAASLVILDGNNQRTPPTFAFSKELKIVVLDNQGSPVPGVGVTFTAPASGASAAFTSTNARTLTASTGPDGVAATGNLAANNQQGVFSISATVSGIGSVNFNVANGAWYVRPGGNDANNCSLPASPCATIGGAVNKASREDTILIGVGTYTESSYILISKHLTVLGGWDSNFTNRVGQSTLQGSLNIGSGNENQQKTIVVIENLTISNNINRSGLSNSGILTFKNGSIINNNSGITNVGYLTIINSTISGNGYIGLTPFSGGGILNQNWSNFRYPRAVTNLFNSSIVNNKANAGGGIYNDSSAAGIVFLKNSLVAGNIAVSGSAIDCAGGDYQEFFGRGRFISLGHNIIGNIGEYNGAEHPCRGNWSPTDLVGDQANPVDPQISSLMNVGNEIWVHPLQLGSPAIDGVISIDCPSTDQRGVSRPSGTFCDVGAYEYEFDHDVNNMLITTYSVGNSSLLPGTFMCDQTDLNCTAGDGHAKAAHKYAAGTYNFYKTKHNRNSIDGNGIEILSSVHYRLNYANAFWNGYLMVYGDGYGFPLADDVVAHELTHGVTQYESNLFYYYQSGAINESFSDLWGEYYDQTNNQGNDALNVKWLIGEDVPVLGALRSMSNPPALGDPDRMSSLYYYKDVGDSGGVHTNSGVNNKAVYLMVDGGTFNNRTVSPLGWDKVGAIYYEAQTKLLASGADYSDLYYALQQACTNLIGQKGITAGDCTEVRDALDAVEMNAQPALNFNPDAPLCLTNTPHITFADDLEEGADNWTFENGNYLHWQYGSPYGQYARSGHNSLYGDDYPQYQFRVTDARAVLDSFLVPNNAFLHFAHAFDFETGYYYGDPTLYNFDGGVLEYRVNGSENWVDASSLIDHNGYSGKIRSVNVLDGRNAFVGSSHGYISTRLNLASLAGRTISFRWRMGLDDAVAVGGWWLDDIKIYTCGPATIFADVPNTYWSWSYIEGLYNAGVTGGCSNTPRNYCPTTTVTRDQMAVFLLRGEHGSSYSPPLPSGVFGDIPTDHWAAAWIERLAAEGVTAGCGSGNYCPTLPVTRDQMAVFLLRAKHGSSYSPPLPSGVFGDVPTDHWAAPWIEQLAAEGITAGCGNGNYCPTTPVSRDQMAVFLVRTFNLPTP